MPAKPNLAYRRVSFVFMICWTVGCTSTIVTKHLWTVLLCFSSLGVFQGVFTHLLISFDNNKQLVWNFCQNDNAQVRWCMTITAGLVSTITTITNYICDYKRNYPVVGSGGGEGSPLHFIQLRFVLQLLYGPLPSILTLGAHPPWLGYSAPKQAFGQIPT